MHEHTTPEERLLKLIRKKDAHPAKEAAGKQGSSKAAAGKGRGVFLESQKAFRFLNKFLVAACLGLLAYVGYELVFVKPQGATASRDFDTTAIDPVVKEAPFEQIAFAQTKPYTYYTAPIEERDIFESPFSTTKKIEEVKLTSSIPELTKNLRLVGIVLDSNSEAVIEDLESKQTFFLHQGDGIRGSIIDEIQESKVILRYQDQRVELVQ